MAARHLPYGKARSFRSSMSSVPIFPSRPSPSQPWKSHDGYNQQTSVQGFGFAETETCTLKARIEDPGEQQPIIPWLSEVVWHISRFNTPASSPFTFALMSVPIYLWLTLLALVCCIITRHRAVQSGSSLAAVGSLIRVFM